MGQHLLTQNYNTIVDEYNKQSCSSSEHDSSPQWNRDDWYEYLSQPGRQLVALHALTEDRFLYFGSFLNDFHKRAMKVSELAALIQAHMVGDEASGSIAQLQLLVERMSIFLHDIRTTSGRNEQALAVICTALEQLHQPLQAFQRITKTLQVVGITTRVECSGFAGNQDNIMHLSDSIRRLGHLIAGNMNEIIDQVTVLSSLSKEALRNESALNNGQSARALAVVEQARAVLAQLVANSSRALQQSESLTDASTSVARSTAEIVSSIQFHDITRQQVEHVTETIDAFSAAISESFQNGDVANRPVLEQEIAVGCRLQSEQLKNSGDELTAAVWRIIESLHSLASNVKTLAHDTRELGGDTQRDGSTFFEAIEPAIESVAAVLNENLATAAHSAQAVNEVVSAASTMVKLVEEIECFGAEMKVIALNASIESVHVKAGGSSLGVIADSIQDLAREALIQTVVLTSGLTSISESAKNLCGSDQEEVTGDDGNVSNLIADSDKMLIELRATNAMLLENFKHMDQSADTLATDISNSAASIQIHREAGAIIQQGVEALTFIADQFGVSSGAGASVETTLLKGIQKRYSMHSERAIHNKVVGGNNVKAGFSRDKSKTLDCEDKQDHGLGTNVELF